MKTALVQLEDTNGALWRLVLYEKYEETQRPRVMLECLYSKTVTGYVPIKFITEDPAEVGLLKRERGVLMLDDTRANFVLIALMREHGATPRPPTSLMEGLSQMGPLPSNEPDLFEPEIPCHARYNLLEFVAELEGCARLASSGMWRAQTGNVLGAVVTGSPTDPVAESMSKADLLYVLMVQPQAGGQIARKLREACSLLQDLSKAALAIRGEIDHLVHPQHRTESYKARLDMFDRWMVVLGLRCAGFPMVQMPDFGGAPPAEAPPRMTRSGAVDLAKRARNASLGLEEDPGDSYSVQSWIVDAIVEASR